VSENIWKDPLKFVPERFDPESSYFKLPNGQKRESITWLAFGAGPRACSGDNFSMYFMKLGLVYLLTMFKLELIDTFKGEGYFYWIHENEMFVKIDQV